MPTDIRERIEAVQQSPASSPSVFLILAHVLTSSRRSSLIDALMDKPGDLSKAKREMIVVATSNVNQFQYCVIAHGAILRIRAKDPLIADQVELDPLGLPDLSPRQLHRTWQSSRMLSIRQRL